MGTSNFQVVAIATVRARDGAGALTSYYFKDAAQLLTSSAPASDTLVLSRLSQALRFTWSLYGDYATRGVRPICSGAITLVNEDGGLDYMTALALDGNACTVRVGPYTLDGLEDNGTITTGTAFEADLYAEEAEVDENQVQLFIRDETYLSDRVALPNVYAGTNSLPNGNEGTDDIKGLQKPAVIGIVDNVTPIRTNISKEIYQLDGVYGFQTGWSLVVKDQGVVLTLDGAGDYANLTAMEATAPAAGQYRVCPTLGAFRLGGTPNGKITCDVVNPVPTATYISPARSTGSEIHLVARRCKNLPTTATDNSAYLVSSGSGSTPDAPDCGIFVTGEVTALEALRTVCRSTNLSYGESNGLWDTLRQLNAPRSDASPYDWVFNEAQMLAFRKVRPGDSERGQPVWRVKVRYNKNWTVMTDAEIAGSVTSATRDFLKQEYREVFASDSSVKTQYPLASEIVVDSLLDSVTDAQAEADRLLAIHKVKRQMYVMDVTLHTYVGMHSQVIEGTGVYVIHSRFSLSSGKNFIVVSRTVDVQAGTVSLVIWG